MPVSTVHRRLKRAIANPPRGTTQRALGLFCRCGAVAGFEAGCRSCGLEETSGSRAPAGLFDVVGRFAGQGGMEGEVCACCLRASNLVCERGMIVLDLDG